MKKSTGLFLLSVGLTILTVSTALATKRTATTTGNWNNNTTWGGSAFPVAGDTAVINGGVTVTIAAGRSEGCAALTLNGNAQTASASQLTLTNSTSSLAVNGDFTETSVTPSNSVTSNITMNGGSLTVGGNLDLIADKQSNNTDVYQILFTGGGTVSV